MAYVDTNVLVAAYSPKDPVYNDARSFLSERQPKKIVSALSFAELTAVLARIRPELQLPEPVQKEPFKRRIRAAVEYIFRDADLTLASQAGTSIIRVGKRTVHVPMEYSRAASAAHNLQLKTLDMLHLAYASLISRLEFKLDLFVTADQDILDRTNKIEESLGLTAKHPKDLP
jgi:predicted nucleic acid-binding protein